MKDLATLKAACDAAIANLNFQPSNGVTHCNQAAQFVSNSMGCHELDGLMADEQCAVMIANKSGLWNKVMGTQASLWAQQGGLAFAGMTSEQLGEAHGHIAACYPAPMQMSGSLGHPVPVLANIGKTNAEEKESAAFPVSKGEASYYIWNS
jgi:hypothetical protein